MTEAMSAAISAACLDRDGGPSTVARRRSTASLTRYVQRQADEHAAATASGTGATAGGEATESNSSATAARTRGRSSGDAARGSPGAAWRSIVVVHSRSFAIRPRIFSRADR